MRPDKTYRRLLELELGLRGALHCCARALIGLASLDAKVRLSEQVWRLQELIEAISGRRSELRVPHLDIREVVPAGWTSLFDGAVASNFSEHSKHRLLACVGAVVESSLSELRPLHDAPTARVMHDVVAWLAEVGVREATESAPSWECCVEAASLFDYAWPELPMEPARSEELTIVSEVEYYRAKGRAEGGDVSWALHGLLFNIEVSATEACAMMLTRFRPDPLAARNLARQCWDEGRHAALALDYLQRSGGHLGMHPIHCEVYQFARRGRTIEDALCREQAISEGLALLRVSLSARDKHRDRGEAELAEFFEWLYVDELQHVKKGIEDFRRLGGESSLGILEALEEQQAYRFFGPYDEDIARYVGFSAADIERHRARRQMRESFK